MAKKIVAVVAALWGAALLLSHLLGFRPIEGDGPYAAGQRAGVAFGALLLFAGLYYLLAGSKRR